MNLDAKTRLEQWLNGIKIAHISHLRASAHYKRLGRGFGIPVVILTTIVGTTVFTSMASSVEYSTGLQLLAGLLSMGAAVISGLATFLNYGELAERHRDAAVKYGNLRRELEEIMCFTPSQDELKLKMTDLRTRWNALDTEAPSVPQNIHDYALRQVKPNIAKTKEEQ
jgi:hypothetical protein